MPGKSPDNVGILCSLLLSDYLLIIKKRPNISEPKQTFWYFPSNFFYTTDKIFKVDKNGVSEILAIILKKCIVYPDSLRNPTFP